MQNSNMPTFSFGSFPATNNHHLPSTDDVEMPQAPFVFGAPATATPPQSSTQSNRKAARPFTFSYGAQNPASTTSSAPAPSSSSFSDLPAPTITDTMIRDATGRSREATKSTIKRRSTAFKKGSVKKTTKAKNNTNPCSRQLKKRLIEMFERCVAMAEEFPVLKTFQPLPDLDLSLPRLLLRAQDVVTEYGALYRDLRAARQKYDELEAVLAQLDEGPVVPDSYTKAEYSSPATYKEAVYKELKEAKRRLLQDEKEEDTEESVKDKLGKIRQEFNDIVDDSDGDDPDGDYDPEE